MMIIIRTIMNVLPEKLKEVRQTLLSLTESPGEERGCLSFGVFADIENENVFNLISEWKSRRHLDLYMRSERFGVLLGTTSLLSKPLSIRIFTVSAAKGMEEVKAVRRKVAWQFLGNAEKGVSR